MRSAFSIQILRSIKGSLGRFLAIMGIVALGCGFYAGLRMTAPDMDMAADEYYDQTNLMDIRVVSTMGLTDDDIKTIAQVDGVEKVSGEMETDAMVTLNDEQYAVRIQSVPNPFPLGPQSPEVSSGLALPINSLVLTEGRLPESPDECVISADNVMAQPVQLGDAVQIDEGVQDLDDVLSVRELKVVGLAHSPLYVSTTAMGSTTLGSGTIDQFMYVDPDAFAEGFPYTEAFITVSGADKLTSGSHEYQARVDEVVKELHGIADEREEARLAQLKSEAQEELDEKSSEFERERAQAEDQLASARRELDDAAAEIEISRIQIERGRAEHASGASALAAEEASAQSQLASAEAQIEEESAKLDEAKAQLDASGAQLDAGWAQAAAAGITKDNASAALEALKAQMGALDPSSPQYASLAAQASMIEQLISGQAAYDAGMASYEGGLQQLTLAREELEAGRQEMSSRISDAKLQLSSALSQLKDGEAKLASGEAEYDSGLAEYEQRRAEADEGFAEAESEIADAQAKIDDISMPEWLVMDRTKIPGAVSFGSDADRIDSIASFFPFIFFLVAALVALTTMTRMVEEERQLIGTFKALGYSRARITSKYLVYAAAASLTGAVLGIVILSLVLPPIIMDAYAIIYSVPHTAIMPLSLPIALSAAALGVGVTLIATWAAAASTLRETPSQLMMPKAPKEGKRILLERVRFIWKHLSFSWKVTFRNIFRYKKRLIMTVIGIAGCTALLLTGLGLYDSVNDIIDKQFGQTVLYNVRVASEDGFTDEARGDLEALTEEDAFAHVDTIMASGPDKSDVSVEVITPEDTDGFEQLWVMRERIGRKALELGPDGVIVTEKLANLLGVSVGDDLTLAEQDLMGNATTDVHGLRVTGIMENYVANYVFLGDEIFTDAFGVEPVPQTMFAKVGDEGDAHQRFREEATQIEGVKTVTFNNETIDAYRKMLSSVNMIVVVLVVAAAALAFIVLYNLTNINITERQREIATLKVLGFTAHEVDMYIYRETILLTVLGALFGLVLGVVLEGFVIVTAEVDYVMFGRDIHLLSFVIAFAVTMLFAALVMLFMRKKLSSIDMISSLKSVE